MDSVTVAVWRRMRGAPVRAEELRDPTGIVGDIETLLAELKTVPHAVLTELNDGPLEPNDTAGFLRGRVAAALSAHQEFRDDSAASRTLAAVGVPAEPYAVVLTAADTMASAELQLIHGRLVPESVHVISGTVVGFNGFDSTQRGDPDFDRATFGYRPGAESLRFPQAGPNARVYDDLLRISDTIETIVALSRGQVDPELRAQTLRDTAANLTRLRRLWGDRSESVTSVDDLVRALGTEDTDSAPADRGTPSTDSERDGLGRYAHPSSDGNRDDDGPAAEQPTAVDDTTQAEPSESVPGPQTGPAQHASPAAREPDGGAATGEFADFLEHLRSGRQNCAALVEMRVQDMLGDAGRDVAPADADDPRFETAGMSAGEHARRLGAGWSAEELGTGAEGLAVLVQRIRALGGVAAGAVEFADAGAHAFAVFRVTEEFRQRHPELGFAVDEVVVFDNAAGVGCARPMWRRGSRGWTLRVRARCTGSSSGWTGVRRCRWTAVCRGGWSAWSDRGGAGRSGARPK